MTFHVLAQVVTAHEAIRADGAHELLLAGVRAKVTRQLVRPRERLVARLPLADIGPFACVHANVRLQMRTLKVAFITIRIRANVISGLY